MAFVNTTFDILQTNKVYLDHFTSRGFYQILQRSQKKKTGFRITLSSPFYLELHFLFTDFRCLGLFFFEKQRLLIRVTREIFFSIDSYPPGNFIVRRKGSN